MNIVIIDNSACLGQGFLEPHICKGSSKCLSRLTMSQAMTGSGIWDFSNDEVLMFVLWTSVSVKEVRIILNKYNCIYLLVF